MKEPEYQQRIHQLEGELRESREREADLRGRLEEAALELRRAKAQVANLERLVEKGQRDLKQSRMRYEEVEKHLTSTIRTTNEELEAVRRELRIVTRDLSDTKKDKKSLEVCCGIHMSVRGLCSCVQCCVVFCGTWSSHLWDLLTWLLLWSGGGAG